MNHVASTLIALVVGMALAGTTSRATGGDAEYSWRYYGPGNTGIQGDYNEAIWIDANGDPYISGHDPLFEEGGFAHFLQRENRWLNYSNVDLPVIGHPSDTGTSRVSDIEVDEAGNLWMATWRGALKFDPEVGAASIINYGPDNSPHPGGHTTDVALAPDGTMWFGVISVVWGGGGIFRYDPSTDQWGAWPNIGEGLVAVQPKPPPSTGYLVWSAQNFNGFVFQFDSDTEQWTTLPMTGALGEVTGIPGKDAVDAEGNLWAWRIVAGGQRALHYRRIDGTWVVPRQPPLAGVIPPVWAFSAYGSEQALLVDGAGVVLRFNGSAWENLGVWRPGAFTNDVRLDETSGVIWASGIGGAARRDPETGVWQRYRITNTGNFDRFQWDLTLDTANSHMYVGANAAPGVGGMVRFDGQRWLGWNNSTYGLGHDWPFPNDNCQALAYRPSNGAIAVSPYWFYGIHEWTGSEFNTLMPLGGAKQLVEDSLGRMWALGEYFNLQYYNGATWIDEGILGWGSRMQRDPEVPGTVWAATGYEIKRTDGDNSFSITIGDLPELTDNSDTFRGLAAAPGGVAWIGSTVHLGVGGTGGALIRVDANDGTYDMLIYEDGWPLPGKFVAPLAVTPDGRVWMQYAELYWTPDGGGLCSYDPDSGAVVEFPGPPGGASQWGGLPHSQIEDGEVRLTPTGYELWLACVSRGVAVLSVSTSTVTADLNGDGIVGPADLAQLLSQWGACANCECPPDLSGDCNVGPADLAELLAHWT